jgi:hypothetical protein
MVFYREMEHKLHQLRVKLETEYSKVLEILEFMQTALYIQEQAILGQPVKKAEEIPPFRTRKEDYVDFYEEIKRFSEE